MSDIERKSFAQPLNNKFKETTCRVECMYVCLSVYVG